MGPTGEAHRRDRAHYQERASAHAKAANNAAFGYRSHGRDLSRSGYEYSREASALQASNALWIDFRRNDKKEEDERRRTSFYYAAQIPGPISASIAIQASPPPLALVLAPVVDPAAQQAFTAGFEGTLVRHYEQKKSPSWTFLGVAMILAAIAVELFKKDRVVSIPLLIGGTLLVIGSRLK